MECNLVVMMKDISLRVSLLSACQLATLVLLVTLSVSGVTAQKRRQAAASSSNQNRTITVKTEPQAIIWLDEVRRGVTDAEGKLVIKNVAAGRRSLRVRAKGFKESSRTLTAAERGEIEVRLARTTDEAELLFQQAEEAREQARDDAAREAAAELYRRAIKLRPRYAEAHVGMARVLLDLNDYNAALEEIDRARGARPAYPEASAVEGRILRMAADTNGAIEAFERAIREGKGFQPEAHTGLAMLYEDSGKDAEAVASFRKAIAQLSDTEPVLYQLLGAIYEKLEQYKEAVAAYEKYLELAPDGSLAPAIRSVMEQLRKQAEGRGGLPF